MRSLDGCDRVIYSHDCYYRREAHILTTERDKAVARLHRYEQEATEERDRLLRSPQDRFEYLRARLSRYEGVVKAARVRHAHCRNGSHVGSGAKRDKIECRALTALDSSEVTE